MPHLIFYGPSGAGKKTRINALLREIFGPSVERVKLERKSFKTPSNKALDITALGSTHHLEINPSDAGNYDRIVVQEVIKEIAQGGVLDVETSRFKVVVLSEADQLSRQAQHGLRRTMEKYVSQCRIIMCCESLSKIIEPVRSRCLTIRVGAPETEEIGRVVMSVAKSEGCDVSPGFASNVANYSHGNLRRALLMLEATKVQVGARLADDAPIQLPDWEKYIALMAKDIFKTQTPGALLEMRSKLYELLANCIPAELIFKTLVDELVKSLDDQLKYQVVHWAAYYEARLSAHGQKAIYHLEAFVAKIMTLYKDYLISMFE